MPDWLTHVLFAWALWNFLSLKFNVKYKGVFLAGSLLPDIKTINMLYPLDLGYILTIFHTPLGALILPGILSQSIFTGRIKQAQIFILLGASSLFHLLFDLMISSMEGRVMLLFPFSFKSYSFNIFMQEDFTLLYIAFTTLVISFIAQISRSVPKYDTR